jgi:membrane protein YqaA with SNARE-associated domain
MGINLTALFWGFAEATVFVLVPDVLLSAAGLDRLRTGFIACLWALTGALAGGGLMYVWGVRDATGTLAVLEKLPAVSPQLLDRVHQDLIAQGPIAIVIGPMFGIPYKIFAVQAPAAGISPWTFLLISIPARFIRFTLITAAAWWISTRPLSRWPRRKKLLLLLACWLAFYAFYFTLMPW